MIRRHCLRNIIVSLTLYICMTSILSAADLRQTLLDAVGRQTRAVRDELLALNSLDEIRAYTAEKRDILMHMNSITRTEPLVNARKVGVIERDDFTVEKIIFESAPGILVPANVYVPKGISGRVPAVLITEGHSATGKSGYHAMCQSFCAQGYVVMTFDPMGQGERGVYYDRTSGNEHVSAGLQGYCAGVHMSKLFVGDGLYAVDYLLSRPDVDPNRICVTGSSGGGAQSLFLGALDKRITVTIPSCFTTLDSMVVAITATHPESNYFGAFAQGITMESLCAMIAPRALLINASKEDFFPIEGTRIVAETARKVFAVAGVPENVALFEGEGGHSYTQQKREEAHRFLARIFGTEPKPEPPIDNIPAAMLDCSESGNIEDAGSATLFDLIRDRAIELRDGRPERVASMPPGKLKSTLKQVLGIKTAEHVPTPDITSDNISTGIRSVNFGYTASDGFTLSGQGFLNTEKQSGWLTVIASPLCEFSSAKLAQPWLARGDVVLIVRPRGTAYAPYRMDGMYKLDVTNANYYFAMGAFNAGRTVVGIQTTDILEAIRVSLMQLSSDIKVRIVGDELLAPAATCAAVFLDEADELVIERGLWGYEGIATNRVYGYYIHPETITVRGILENFDLPELALASGCDRVIWKSPADHNGVPLVKHGRYEFETLVNRLSVVLETEGRVE
ncbi:alpha/beta hydrolase family protein [Candidatus Latescibacterota bacterium]